MSIYYQEICLGLWNNMLKILYAIIYNIGRYLGTSSPTHSVVIEDTLYHD